jgi:hypothetical protein
MDNASTQTGRQAWVVTVRTVRTHSEAAHDSCATAGILAVPLLQMRVVAYLLGAM